MKTIEGLPSLMLVAFEREAIEFASLDTAHLDAIEVDWYVCCNAAHARELGFEYFIRHIIEYKLEFAHSAWRDEASTELGLLYKVKPL